MNKLQTQLLSCLTIFLVSNSIYGQESDLKFNHLYVVTDSITFESIYREFKDSDLVNVDQGMPSFSPIDSNTTTIYIRGKHTYLELMSPNNKFNEPVGRVGLGFSFDTEYPFKANINNKMRNGNCPEFEEYSYSHSLDNDKILWYKTYYDQKPSDLAVWYAFYNPEFLAKLFTEEINQYRRQDFLKKCYNPDKLISDIKSIELDCNEADFNSIIAELKCLGIKPKSQSNSKTTLLIADVSLELSLKKIEKTKINKISFSTKLSQNIDIKLGKLNLKGKDRILGLNF